jgi:(S)-2-hydroxyglutarate dehydrogenase
MFDVIIIGGGIVGTATAWQLKRRYPGADMLLIEKEASLAKHQTGHNSGVVHAGVYYSPGTLKADFCKRGAAFTAKFCREHGLAFERCGKLLVATDDVEYERMRLLERRCGENDIDVHRLSAGELLKQEPDIRGVGALHVPATGIADYRKITMAMAREFRSLGGKLKMGRPVVAMREVRGGVTVQVPEESVKGRFVVACAGLMADRLARMMGIETDFRIIPFRGEYYRLPTRLNRIVNHLIYPLPDPDLPFLGVHLTRMIDGTVTVGPNAVLGWKREGYGRINVDPGDIREMISYPGFWRVIYRHLWSGMTEMRDSLFSAGYLRRVRKYCPRIRLADLRPHPAGVRAQAVRADGRLVNDFLFAESDRSLHVCNAPSPAATSAMPIGEFICNRVEEKAGAIL